MRNYLDKYEPDAVVNSLDELASKAIKVLGLKAMNYVKEEKAKL